MHDLRVNKYSTSVTATTLLKWSRINSYGIEGYMLNYYLISP
jgi:hypothetical protein